MNCAKPPNITATYALESSLGTMRGPALRRRGSRRRPAPRRRRAPPGACAALPAVHAAAVEDRDRRRTSPAISSSSVARITAMHARRVVGRRVLPGADRPHRLVRDQHRARPAPASSSASPRAAGAARPSRSRPLRARSSFSPTQSIGVRPACEARARTSARVCSSVSPKTWRRSEWPTSANVRAGVARHRRRDLAGERALRLPSGCSARRRGCRCGRAARRRTAASVDRRREEDHRAIRVRAIVREERSQELAGVRGPVIHLPVGREDAVVACVTGRRARRRPGATCPRGTRATRRRRWTRGSSAPRARPRRPRRPSRRRRRS